MLHNEQNSRSVRGLLEEKKIAFNDCLDMFVFIEYISAMVQSKEIESSETGY